MVTLLRHGSSMKAIWDHLGRSQDGRQHRKNDPVPSFVVSLQRASKQFSPVVCLMPGEPSKRQRCLIIQNTIQIQIQIQIQTEIQIEVQIRIQIQRESYLSCHSGPWSGHSRSSTWSDVKVGSLPVDRDKLVAWSSFRDDPVKTWSENMV